MKKYGKNFYVLQHPCCFFKKIVYPSDEKTAYKWWRYYGFTDWGESMEPRKSPYCSINKEHNRRGWYGYEGEQLSVILPRIDFGSFLWTPYWNCIVTRQTLDMFRDEGFTGFDVRPVVVERIKTRYEHKKDCCDDFPGGDSKKKILENINKLPPLWELRIEGETVDAHPDSMVELIENCDACGFRLYSNIMKVKKGLKVDESKWNGSDFFHITGFKNYLIISERVKEFIVTHSLTNCMLIQSDILRQAYRR